MKEWRLIAIQRMAVLKYIILSPLLILGSVSNLLAQYTLRCEKDQYIIHSGDTVTVQVIIDPVPAAGLYSVGVKAVFPGEKFLVTGLADIILPAELDSNGFGGPPDKATGYGFAGAAGAVVHVQPYRDTLVLTIHGTDITPAGTEFDQYFIDLSLFLDGLQANFVDFDGMNLDPQITFHSTVISVTVIGDFNGDHRVDLIDFSRLAEYWLDSNCGSCEGLDTNNDSSVGVPDLIALTENWLQAE